MTSVYYIALHTCLPVGGSVGGQNLQSKVTRTKLIFVVKVGFHRRLQVFAPPSAEGSVFHCDTRARGALFLSDPGKPGVRSLGPDVRLSVRQSATFVKT